MTTSIETLQQRMNRLALAAMLLVTLAGWLGHGVFAAGYVPPNTAGQASMTAGNGGHFDLQRPDASRILAGARSDHDGEERGGDSVPPPALPLFGLFVQGDDRLVGPLVPRLLPAASLPPARAPPLSF